MDQIKLEELAVAYPDQEDLLTSSLKKCSFYN